MSAIRTALIGCGARSRGHGKAVHKSGAIEIVCACDLVEQRAREGAEEWGAKAILDYREALADETVEAVDIVTDVGSHLGIAADAVRAGKHVMLEKPLGSEIKAARDLVELGEASGLVIYVCFQLRFSPKQVWLKSAAEKIDPVQTLFSRQRGMMKPQFLNPSPFCGIMDACAHDFDQVAWIMGRPPVAVTAAVRHDTFTRGTGATDAVSALIDFGDGRSATVVSSIGAPGIGTKMDIVGARGNARMDPGGGVSGVVFAEYESEGEKEPLEFEAPGGVDPDVELVKAFAAEVREGTRSQAAALRDGLHSMLITLACLRSCEEGRRVELAELS